MAGVSVGGAVTTEMLVHAIAQGSRLAVLMITFGAVNALASPSRLLRSLPGGALRSRRHVDGRVDRRATGRAVGAAGHVGAAAARPTHA